MPGGEYRTVESCPFSILASEPLMFSFWLPYVTSTSSIRIGLPAWFCIFMENVPSGARYHPFAATSMKPEARLPDMPAGSNIPNAKSTAAIMTISTIAHPYSVKKSSAACACSDFFCRAAPFPEAINQPSFPYLTYTWEERNIRTCMGRRPVLLETAPAQKCLPTFRKGLPAFGIILYTFRGQMNQNNPVGGFQCL